MDESTQPESSTKTAARRKGRGAVVDKTTTQPYLDETTKTVARRANSESVSASDILVDQWKAERPDLDFSTIGPMLRIRALAMLMDSLAEESCKKFGLKSAELYLLYALRRGGSPYRMRPTEIYRLLRVTSGTITYRIDNLESMGFVVRVPDPNDRRSMVIELTRAGKDIADRAMDNYAESLSGLGKFAFDDLCDSDGLNRVLSKICLFLEQSLQAPSNPLVRHTELQTSQPSKRRGRPKKSERLD